MKLLKAKCGNRKKMSILDIAHAFIEPYFKDAKNIMDATAGNGYDTLFLAEKSKNDAVVYAFDIQKKALENTFVLLEEAGLTKKVILVNETHANFDKYLNNIDIAVFNLGYLPNGDKSITTKAKETLKTVDFVLRKLNLYGLVCIVSYLGHEEGKKEFEKLQDYLLKLSQKEFTVVNIKMLNWQNEPPQMFFIRREALSC